jgi:phenylacetate-CoA ligase
MSFGASIRRNIIRPLWMAKNNTTDVFSYGRELKRTQYLPPDELHKLRWNRLCKILNYSYEHVPYYKRWFWQLGITPQDIQSHDDLLRLPLLTKQDIQINLHELISDKFDIECLIREQTGGSTGSPLGFYFTPDRELMRWAVTERHDSWAHLNVGDRVASLWGAARDISSSNTFKAKLINYLQGPTLMLDASSLSEDKMYDFAIKLQKFRPKVILAYANTMRLFAEFIEINKIQVPRPESIICSAEVLPPESRALIEKVFGTIVFNRYGCREFSIIASECEIHKGMHIGAEYLYLEFIKDDRHIFPGEMGEIIITDMMNYGMPLIRYQIKDYGAPLDGLCICGRTLPLMDLGAGRETDFLVTPEGRYVSGVAVCTYVITNISGIKQAQIIQERPNHILIKLVKGDQFTNATIASLNLNIDRLVSKVIEREFQFVDEIPSTASGKYRFCISNVRNIT